MSRKLNLVVVFLFLAAPLIAATPSIIRGPYLQMMRPGSIFVLYETDMNCDSVIRYGKSEGNLDLMASDSASTTEHVLQLTGLETHKTYYYSIETSSSVLASGNKYRFLTGPDDHHQGVNQRFWVIGNSGTGDQNANAVRDAYLAFMGNTQTGMILMLGDNALPNGSRSMYRWRVFEKYKALLRQAMVLPALGDVDTDGSTNPPANLSYFDLFMLPQGTQGGGVASGTEKYFSINYGIVHIVCLDSQASDRSPTGPMLTWLQNDLAANTYPWIIAYFHHSPYSKGNHDSDSEQQMAEMRESVLPILESYGVDLVLTAHSNSYERSYFLNGHYGESHTLTPGMIINNGDGKPGSQGGDGVYYKPAGATNGGAVYVVVGSSGAAVPAPLNHPAMFASEAQLGSLAIDLKNNKLEAKFVRTDGTIGDTFTIVKNNQSPVITMTSPLDGAEFTSPSSIEVSANVTDADTHIRRVSFFRNSTLIGRVFNSPPWTITWMNPPKGTYQIYGIAIDDMGASTTSDPVTITVH